MSSLVIRITIASDFHFIYKVHRQLFYSYIEQTWGWKEDIQHNGMREDFDNSLFKIICYQEKEIGVISVIDQQDCLFLNYLAILPSHQRRGFGTQLLNIILKEATGRNIPVKLNVLRVNPARAFYKRFGFRVTSMDKAQCSMEWRNTYPLHT